MISTSAFWAEIADGVDPALRRGHLAPDSWRSWLRALYPSAVTKPFAAHHEQFWDWLWGIERGIRPRPFVGIWPRGGGKSTAAELATASLGARGKRRYVLYVSATQPQADKRVENIAALLESESAALYYPEMSRRAVGKFGASKGWRRNRLRTASGFTVDALGLETAAARGLKVEDQRPDLIVLDDVDDRHDTAERTKKKIASVTDTILPIGSGDLAVLAIQNLIIGHGIFAQLGDGSADFLADRIVSGPVPAVRNLRTVRWEAGEPIPEEAVNAGVVDLSVFEDLSEAAFSSGVRHVIVAGEPTWAGQDLDKCQALINTSSINAFLREQQHQVTGGEGALWRSDMIRRAGSAPPLRRIVIGVDPSGGKAEIGIVAAGLGIDGIAYVLRDFTQPGHKGPENWGHAVVDLFDLLTADLIAAEVNFGGDMVAGTVRAACDGRPGGRDVPVKNVVSSRSKRLRAEPIALAYADNRVRHVGVFPELEDEMQMWVPGDPSPNRIDALVFALTELLLPESQHRSGAAPMPGRKRRRR